MHLWYNVVAKIVPSPNEQATSRNSRIPGHWHLLIQFRYIRKLEAQDSDDVIYTCKEQTGQKRKYKNMHPMAAK